MQNQLQQVYDLSLSYRVDDFLITKNSELNSIEGNQSSRPSAEKLLIRQHNEDLDIALYIAEELIQNLEQHNPYQCLDHKNIQAFCTALEGVSHFLYLTWNAGHNRCVSQLELELQAEVDKFVTLYSLCKTQGSLSGHDMLLSWLFEHCSFASNLNRVERIRYQTANKLAHRFCQRIGRLIENGNDQSSPYRELRRFYRRRHHHKLDGIDEPGCLPGP